MLRPASQSFSSQVTIRANTVSGMTFARRVLGLLLISVGLVVLAPAAPSMAHQDGCHAAHSCPSDANPPTYMCGDTGNYTYCPGLSGSASVYPSTGATVGSALSGSVSWSVAVSSASRTYQWYRAGAAIPGAVTSTYTVTDADIGYPLVLMVAAVDGRGQAATASSTPITPAYPPLPAGSAQLVTPSATVGTAILAAVAWSRPATAAYQWLRADMPIPGATLASYTVTKDDLGQPLRLVATVTEHGRTVSVSTASLTPMAAATLTLTTRSTIRAGKNATLRGALSTVAGPAGRMVQVQSWHKAGRRWVLRNTASAVVSTTGTFVVKQRIRKSRKGPWRFKATFAGAPGVYGAQSPFAVLDAR